VSRGTRIADVFLFATAFVITFAKIRFATPIGDVYLSDVTASLFLVAFLAHRIGARDWSVSRTAAVLAAFFAAFLVVFLIGFYNLDTATERDQFVKGLAKFAIHFGFLVAAVAYLSRRSARLYWQTLAFFTAGFAANAAYGLLQLGLAETSGRNLDEMFLGRLGLYERGGISVFGTVGEENVYRTNALTLDPNHLGVMLIVPLLVLFPVYLRLGRGDRLRLPLALLLAFFVLVELTTLSRSGALGIAVGLVVLAIPYRHLFLKPRFLVPLGALAAVVAVVVAARSGFFETIFEVRTQTSGRSTQLHFQFYSLIRPAIEEHPFFGLGLNTFSVYYELLTGRTNWGPHSYYVALLTETGIVGTALFAGYLVFLFRRLGALRRLGRGLAALGDRAAARVRPLAWGLTAALLGTMAANVFYLTMQMYYFFMFAVLVAAAPVVFARR
jgi:O-Antigen ligase